MVQAAGYPEASSGVLEQIRHAEAYKEEGNRHHAAGSFKKALGAYHKVFCYLNGLQEEPAAQSSAKLAASSTCIPRERVEGVRQLKQSARLNMAACYIKLEEHQKCIEACGRALEFGDSVKAYFRRAQAQAELRNFAGAAADLERAKSLSPEDAAIAVELRRLRALEKGSTRAERQQAAKMISTADAAPDGGRASRDDSAAEAKAAGEPCDTATAPAAEQADTAAAAEKSDTAGTAAEPCCKEAASLAASGRGPPVVQPVSGGGPHQDEASKPSMLLRQLTYSWLQTDDDIKIYIPFDQSDELSEGVEESRVDVEYGEWSILLVIRGSDASDPRPPLGLRLGDFHGRLATDRCRCTVRGSRITLRLAKQVKEHWWNLLQSVPLSAS